jgi:hypothetical protein
MSSGWPFYILLPPDCGVTLKDFANPIEPGYLLYYQEFEAKRIAIWYHMG